MVFLARVVATAALWIALSGTGASASGPSVTATTRAFDVTDPSTHPRIDDPGHRAACDAFVPQMLSLAETRPASGDLAADRSSCVGAVEPRFLSACVDVAEAYGLENVHQIASLGGDFLCEMIARGPADTAGRMLADHAREWAEAGRAVRDRGDLLLDIGAGDAGASAIDLALAQRQQQLSAPAQGPGQQAGAGGGANAVAGLNAIGGGLSMLNSQVTTQQMHMNQELDSATEKLRRAEARNRALNRDMRELRKETWRAQPGHCDCCDGCLVQ